MSKCRVAWRKEWNVRLHGARSVLIAAALYLLMRLCAQIAPIRGEPGASVILLSVALFMLIQMAIVRAASGLPFRQRALWTLAVVFALLVVGLSLLLAGVKMPAVPWVLVSALRDLALILFAVSLGSAVSVVIREVNVLLPVAIFAAVVDFWSVNYGPLGTLLATKPRVVVAAAVQVPVVGRAMPISMIGVGDFVFLALYFAVMHRFRMNTAGAFWCGFFLLTATMFAVIRVEWLNTVPALVPIGVALIAANVKHFRLKREEVVSTLIVGLGLLVLMALWVVLDRPRG